MGAGTQGCMIFCYLNAVCGFFIAYCFKIGISSLAIVACENKWELLEKSRACRNASIMYLVIAIVLTVRFQLQRRKENANRYENRVHDYNGGMTGAEEEVPLLRQNNANYGSNQ
ncbi:hypothetical protein AGDE_01773 [Angomonas deanei]|uniref:Uncharacterized protein n=1 Tax=Angomonas deanei TaxID=59799 RepID=S9X1E5_9TRYP|nr:hypothetical protein AGDE_02346 [Angomonas deanei]EPY42150.1 hypothetical protein AGDE_01773 [Angomonas deanei]CAD2214961.1 hypothetical protein, conserved [Angomonas deanei]|eukprot:EPY41578.1 hypothetical protein AGDE_02346 [Angomonas deanei]